MERSQRTLASGALLFLVVAACRALPPPPVFAPHAATAPDEQGDVTVMLAIGTVGQFAGGDGWGVALRVERQQTDRTTVGGELTGGRGSEGKFESGGAFRQSLLGVRAYGRYSPPGDDYLAFGYGVGVSWMRTGLVTATVQASAEVSYVNDHFVPLVAISSALAVPLRRGRAFGDVPWHVNFGEPEPMPPRDPLRLRAHEPTIFRRPALDFYVGLDVGGVVPIGDTGNQLSADLGVAAPVRARDLLFTASAGEAQRFKP